MTDRQQSIVSVQRSYAAVWPPLFVIALLTSLMLLCTACSEKKTDFQLQGVAMTIPYHIIVGNGTASEESARDVIEQTFQQVDGLFNKWNPNSEISQLNRWDSPEPFHCSPALFAMLRECQRFVFISKGRFDPTVEPLEQAWKRALDTGVLPRKEEIDAILPALGWSTIHLMHSSVVKEHPKTAFDLGGIAKGHAVDLLTERLTSLGFASVYVEWGGEIRTHGSHPEGRPWKVGIRHPYSDSSMLQVIETEDVALATSGDYLQYWTICVDGTEKQFFHVFDLQAGKPLETTHGSLVSVTIQHESCLVADALTKMFLFSTSKEEATALFDSTIRPHFPTAKIWMFSHDDANCLP